MEKHCWCGLSSFLIVALPCQSLCHSSSSRRQLNLSSSGYRLRRNPQNPTKFSELVLSSQGAKKITKLLRQWSVKHDHEVRNSLFGEHHVYKLWHSVCERNSRAFKLTSSLSIRLPSILVSKRKRFTEHCSPPQSSLGITLIGISR